MGNDGGSIAKRRDLARDKRVKKPADRDLKRTARYNLCALTQERLAKPIVACRLGYLLNKSGVIEGLLRKDLPKHLSHISSLRDLKELKLTPNQEGGEWSFMCPVTNQEMNGNHRFVVVWDCGCVLSEQALKLSSNSCIFCGLPYTSLVSLNMSDEEREAERATILAMREKRHAKKEEGSKAEAPRKRRRLVDSEELMKVHAANMSDKTYAALFSKTQYEETFCCRNMPA